MPRRKHLWPRVVILSLGLHPSAIFAQPAQGEFGKDAAAEAAFADGLKAFEQKTYDIACPKLAAAVELAGKEALGGMLLLAECYERTDKFASAWALYRAVEGRAAQMGQPERRKTAERGVSRLEPLLHRVKLVIPDELKGRPNAQLLLDGQALPRDAWDVALPLDSGPHTFQVKGDAPVVRITIASSPGSSEVRILVGAPSEAQGASKSPYADVGRGEEAEGRPVRWPALALLGVGAIAMGVSTGIALDAKSQYDEAKGLCPNNGCVDDAKIEDARSQGNIATGVFLGGAAFAAAGLVYWIVSGSSPAKPQTSAVELRGYSIYGRF